MNRENQVDWVLRYRDGLAISVSFCPYEWTIGFRWEPGVFQLDFLPMFSLVLFWYGEDERP